MQYILKKIKKNKSLNFISSYILLTITPIILLACSSSLFDKQIRDIKESKRYFVSKIDAPITIDGRDNEASWKDIEYSTSFVDILSGKKAEYSTQFKCARDDENIYFFIKLEEPHIRGLMTSRDTLLYNENCFEIFIDPDNDGENYLELEINARETVFDLVMNKPYTKGGKSNIPYNIKGLKHRTNIEGTINNPNDEDLNWTIEIAIQLSTVFELSKYGIEKSKFLWRVHFARMQFPVNIHERNYVNDSKMLPQVWVWNKQSKYDNHMPDEWGYLVF